MTSLEDLLPGVEAAARGASAAILAHYEGDVAAGRKSDGSPVTAADEAAEAVILPALAALTPDIPVISEEAHGRGMAPPVDGTYWLVDPLDGTKEFLKRNGEFTVNIALIRDGRPVLGVVLVPVTGECYAGIVGTGAWRRVGDGMAEAIRVRMAPTQGLTVASSRSHADTDKLDRFLAPYPVREHMVAGSSLKFCRIAEGRADLYPRLGPTMEWDTAAGQAVLEAAGGLVTTLEGAPFRYGRPGFTNPHFLAVGDPRITPLT